MTYAGEGFVCMMVIMMISSTYKLRGKDILQIFWSSLHSKTCLPNPVKCLSLQRLSGLARIPSMVASIKWGGGGINKVNLYWSEFQWCHHTKKFIREFSFPRPCMCWIYTAVFRFIDKISGKGELQTDLIKVGQPCA